MTITQDQLLDLIAEETVVDRAKLAPEATLADLGVSSLDVVTVLYEIETRYDVSIEGSGIPEMLTLGDMTEFLLSLINAEAS